MASDPSPSAWSPQWRSLHPELADDKILDELKAHLEHRRVKGAIVSLQLFKQGHPCFRLPDGRLCHWGHVPKVASLSLEAAICKGRPHLWRGPHKNWRLLPGQQPAPFRVFTSTSPSLPAHLFLQRQQRPIIGSGLQEILLPDPGDEYLPPSAPNRDLVYPYLLVNAGSHIQKLADYHTWYPKPFHPRKHADIRFCVLRQPIDRFLSAVAYLRRRYGEAKRQSPQESLEKRITELENAQSGGADKALKLDIHLKPHIQYLGRDPAYYTHIFRMGEWQRLQHFLSDWLGAPVRLPHHNQTKDEERAQLTPAQKQKVEAFYAEDYQIWGKYF